MLSSFPGGTRVLTAHHPRDLLAERIVLQPYGFWHRPLVRAGAIAIGLALGVIAAAWLYFEGSAGPAATRAANDALRGELEAARRALDAERLRTAELAREVEKLAREAQRLREEVGAAQQKALRRREKPQGGQEGEVARAPQPAPAASTAEAPPAAPRTD
jgi:hypothetical protein